MTTLLSLNIKVQAGGLITCPSPVCGINIGHVLKPLIAGNLVLATDIEWLDAPRSDGDPCVCSKCGSEFLVEGKIHTLEGWK